MIKKESFGNYELYTISNDALSISVTTLGATLTGVNFAGKNRVLSYDSPQDYLERTSYIGAIVGRYANRIADAKFELNDKSYKLIANENGNQLHGGPEAFDKRKWLAGAVDDFTVKFELVSPEGDNGYPGNLTADVIYRLCSDGFEIRFEATADADTIFAPTTHTYWRLGDRDVRKDILIIDADKYIEIDKNLIPTGAELAAEGYFDFHSPKEVGGFFDHCFLLNDRDEDTVPALTLTDGDLTMDLFTDYPALQMYTGPINGFADYAGLALEPEYVPNSPNLDKYDKPILKKGEKYSKYIRYCFR